MLGLVAAGLSWLVAGRSLTVAVIVGTVVAVGTGFGLVLAFSRWDDDVEESS